MKSRSTIKQELRNALTSAAWSGIKNSLLGNELISLGAEIIYRNAELVDKLKEGFDYTQCSYTDLIALGRKNGITVSKGDPSYVKVSGSQVKPYDTITVGGLTFWSTKFYRPEESATYYLGTPLIVSSNGSKISGVFFDGQTGRTTVDCVAVGPAVTEGVYRLGYNVLPESVLAYYSNSNGTETRQLPIDSALLNNDTNPCLGVFTLEDGSLAVEPRNMNQGDVWNVEFLTMSWADFDSEATDVSEVHIGSSDSIEYARKKYYNEVAKHSVITSTQGIMDYVNSYSNVLDSSVKVEADKRYINVYVKPVDVTTATIDYSNILYDLKVYGDVFAEYAVQQGSPVTFQFMISNMPSGDQTSLTTDVLNIYNRNNIKFSTLISAADVQNLAYSKYGVSVSVYLVVSEHVNIQNGAISPLMVPIQGSIVMTKNNAIVGWDNDGIIDKADTFTRSTNLFHFFRPNGICSGYGNSPHDEYAVVGQYGRALILRDFGSDGWSFRIYDTLTKAFVWDEFDAAMKAIVNPSISSLNWSLPSFIWINSSTNPMFYIYDRGIGLSNRPGVIFVLRDCPFWHAPSMHTPVFNLLYALQVSGQVTESTDTAQTVLGFFPSSDVRCLDHVEEGSTPNFTFGAVQPVVVVNDIVYSFQCSNAGAVTMHRSYKNGLNLVHNTVNLGTVDINSVTAGYDDRHIANAVVIDGDIFLFTDSYACYKLALSQGSTNLVRVASPFPAFAAGLDASGLRGLWFCGDHGISVESPTGDATTHNIYFLSGFKKQGSTFTCEKALLYTKSGVTGIANFPAIVGVDTGFVAFYDKVGPTGDFSIKSYDGSIENTQALTTIDSSTDWKPSYGPASPYRKGAVAGTVNYVSGIISTSDTTLDDSELSYRAISTRQLTPDKYFEINAENPIVWR